jgi:hypothetical protein
LSTGNPFNGWNEDGLTGDDLRKNRPSIDEEYLEELSVLLDAIESNDRVAARVLIESVRARFGVDLMSNEAMPLTSDRPIEPGQSVWVTTQPQRAPFRGRLIATADRYADYFDVEDILVGNRSQLLKRPEKPIPGEALAMRIGSPGKERSGLAINLEDCEVGMDLSIVVCRRQDDRGAAPFSAIVIGRELYQR